MNNINNELVNTLPLLEFLTRFLTVHVCFLLNNRVLDSFFLNMQYKPKNIRKVTVPPELKRKYSAVEIDNLFSKKIRKIIYEFAEVLKKEFPDYVLTNFYNNINNVKIKRGLLQYSVICSSYSSSQNTIALPF